MEKFRDFLYKRPVLFTLILIVVELLIVHLPLGDFSKQLWVQVIKEIVLAGIALFFVYVINGKGEVVYSSKGMGFAFKKGWWVFVIAFLSFGLSISGVIGKHMSIAAYPLLTFLLIIFYALFIGLFEEGLFRGLFLNALLAKNGNSIKGILKAVIISSVLFGFAHVATDLIPAFSDPSQLTFTAIAQMIAKTIQTGIVGFILAAIILRNHSLWSVAFIHGLNDFIMLTPNYLFNLQALGDYVSSSYGWIQLLFYIAIIILSLPLVFVGYRIIKKLPLPQPGMFKVCWFPLVVNDKKQSF